MRRTGLTAMAVLFASVATAGAGGCGSGDALVGGACASGYARCGNACVDLSNDPANCGGCGVACAAGVACVAGECAGSHGAGGGDGGAGDGAGGDGLAPTPEPFTDAAGSPDADGSVLDVASLDGPGADAPASDATGTDAPASDATGADAPTSDATGADAPTSDATGADVLASDAGDGGSVTDGPASDGSSSDGGSSDAVAPDGSTGDGAPAGDAAGDSSGCNAPMIFCGASCIDVTSDPDNCGACGNACPSNLCAGSTCQGAAPGDDIVIGHDYKNVSAASAEARVLANAALLRFGSPLKILSFEEYADAATVANAKAILSAAAAARGRTLAVTVTSSDAYVTANLTIRNFDLLLVHDQASASAPTLSALGSSWASTLRSYLSAGGAVITLDGAAGNGQMPAFLTQSALLAVTSHSVLAPGSAFTVAAPGDAVATGVLSPYGAVGASVAMTAEPAGSSNVYVVVHPTGNAPVVIHKLVP